MPKKKDFHRPEKPIEQMREIFNEPRISKKAEIKRKFNRNLKLSLTFLRKPTWDI